MRFSWRKGSTSRTRGQRFTAGSRQASFMLKQGLTIRGGFAGYGLPNPDERDPAA